jgi:serine/threonine-protein kinase
MGSVYLAEQVYDGASLGSVALKFLQPMGTAQEQEFLRKKFISEAGFARLFNSPHIIKVYDFGTHKGETYMAMEFLQGESLADVLYRKGTLSISTLLNYASQIAEALVEIHSHNVIHRDIKPENVLVLEGNYVKLLDFGIAKRIDPGFQKSSTHIGTPAYMPPEQVRGEPIDARADLYALGILMYSGLVGEPPFNYESLEEMHTVSLPITDIANARPGLPEPLRGLINSMIHPEPSRRPESAREVLDALRSIQPAHEEPTQQPTLARPHIDNAPTADMDLEPTNVAARFKPPQRVRIKPVHRPRTWGTGQVIAAIIILAACFAVGDYLYLTYLKGLTWNEIVQGDFLRPAPESVGEVASDAGAAGDAPGDVEEKKD